MQNNPPMQSAEERFYEKPVAWLLGRQYKATLKWILLYAAFGSKVDPRDWMQAGVYPPPAKPDDAAARDAATPDASVSNAEGWQAHGDEFWFDYISDTGDGMTATYSIAYLCLSDWWTAQRWESLPPEGAAEVAHDPKTGSEVRLPRGQFLLIGGDTTYHMSDYASLTNRFQTPFRWAFEDLRNSGRIPADEPRRPLFGIPGNHDYYDMLDGFRRQFRRPVRSEATDYPPGDLSAPQLMIPGFKRCQEASYVGLRLPFDWWLWGLDAEVGSLDGRQRNFFRSLTPDGVPPDKLIVATCAPTTVFGKRADPDDEKTSKAFEVLGLAQPFLEGGVPLKDGQCRLDLSGDIHHYARYWGPPNDGARPRSQACTAPAPNATNYASVVSGIGGAFHHPTTTYVDEIQEQALYPSEKDSREEVARRIFKFINVWRGGSVWLIGFILAFVIYWAATVPSSSKRAVGLLLGRIMPVAESAERRLTGTSEVTSRQSSNLRAEQPDVPPLTIASEPSTTAPASTTNYRIGIALLYLSLLVTGAAFALRNRLFGSTGKKVEVGRTTATTAQNSGKAGDAAPDATTTSAARAVTRVDSEVFSNPAKRLWLLVAVVGALVVFGVSLIKPYLPQITPFRSSMLVLCSLIWAAAALALGFRYSDWLFKQTFRRTVKKRDWALAWVLTILSVISPAAGLWLFGNYNLPAFLASDITVVLITATLGLFMIFPMAVSTGGANQRVAGKLGMFFVGVWLVVLQFAVPFLLVRRGSLLAWLLVPVVILAFRKVGEVLLARNLRWPLLAVWLVYGVLMLALPFVTNALFRWLPPILSAQPFADEAAWPGWWGLVPAILAGVVGAIMCCLWFGWYLAVTLTFHGHNNEVGGAARIERFKEFIRIRLTANDLTGYVIAVDDPKENGAELRPRIVDVFRLQVR